MLKNTYSAFLAVITVMVVSLFASYQTGLASPFGDEPIVIEQTSQQSGSSITVEPAATSETIDDTVVITPAVKPEKNNTANTPANAPRVSQQPVTSVTTVTAAPAETSKILPGYEDQSVSIDGDNYCGQFAMSTVFKGLGIAKDPQQVYKDTNPRGIFTAAPVIVSYLNKNGVPARQVNGASIEDIVTRIDAGKPVMLLVDSGDGTPHWINIYGYTRSADGKIASFRMRDSYWGTRSGHEMAVADLIKAWKSPFGETLAASATDYRNVMVDIGNGGKPQSPFATATEDNIASGINNVVTGYTNRDWGQLAGGATKLITGLAPAVLGLTSKFTGKLGTSMAAWGTERWNSGGIGNKIAGGSAVVAGKVIKAASWVGQTVSDGLSSVSSALGNGINRLFGR